MHELSWRPLGGSRLALACATLACATLLVCACAAPLAQGALHAEARAARHSSAISPLLALEGRLTGGGEAGAGQFGYSVALSADGITALVGGPDDAGGTGAVWVFTRSGSTWQQQGSKLRGEAAQAEEPECVGEASGEAEECGFGRSVALSADGNTALIGAPRTVGARGRAWVFARSSATGEWSVQAQFGADGEDPDEGRFGRSVALSSDGGTALVGSPAVNNRHGAAFVFSRTGSSWGEDAKLTAPSEVGEGYFGRSVSLSGAGATALIGEPGEEHFIGAAWLFARSGDEWSAQQRLTGTGEQGEGRFGVSVSLARDGGTALIGARTDNERAGAAFVFTPSEGGEWTQQGPKLVPSDAAEASDFATSTALSANGDEALIGTPVEDAHAGAAWLFARTGSSWAQTAAKLSTGVGGPAWFGADVALSADGGTALMGSPKEGAKAGAAWSIVPAESTTPPSGEGETQPTPQLPGGGGVLGSMTSLPGSPVLAVNGNLTPVSGSVTYQLPGSHTFVSLTGIVQVPFGTLIDARHGRVRVTTARRGGGTQTIEYYEGEFMLTQARNGRVIATLAGGNFSVCPTARERAHRASASRKRASRKHLVRKLWSSGHGSYTTKGNYATGAVLGTRWLTEDRCNSTWIHVATDRVKVTNLVDHSRHTVKAGRTYIAKARP